MHKTTAAFAACALLGTAGTAAAQQQGDAAPRWPGTPGTAWTLRAGVAHIAPHSRSTDATGPFLPGPPSGVSLEVENKATAFLSVARALNPNLEIELAVGYPPTHDVHARIAAFLPSNVQPFNGQTVARVRQMAPTAFLNYTFGEEKATWRPFVGLGVNYTRFDKRTATAAGNALNGGPTKIDLEDSWGLAAQAGLDYRVDDRWSIHGSVATARVRSHLTATTAGQARQLDIRFHPVVLTLSAGYRF